ncbi:hypothetical protein [Sphingomonas abietis]|uniref:Uncharacterized protein n=1 Tax=Sphingomonas abietis TaxID=3012344 RepID=A0ABY7NJL8_9SPHN|nr:hypothetical protein [Sphingomonas abietis]WBO21714.1 hypothetical protein PBT88_16305 [Sphingomonas abietis]
MPKMTDRERLAKIEADQEVLANEAETVRRSLRAHYGTIVADLPAERLSERDFRDVLMQAVRVGGPAAITALKALPGQSDSQGSGSGSPAREAPARRKPVQAVAGDGGQSVTQP